MRRRREAPRALRDLALDLHELTADLTRLAGLSQDASQDDVAVVARESVLTARLLERLESGERFAPLGRDEEITADWRALAAHVSKARLLGQGPHRIAKLQAATVECEQLRRLVQERLSALP